MHSIPRGEEDGGPGGGGWGVLGGGGFQEGKIPLQCVHGPFYLLS